MTYIDTIEGFILVIDDKIEGSRDVL